MPLIEVKVNPDVLERGVRALERIADSLEHYLFPKPTDSKRGKPKDADALIEFDEAQEWEREQEDERQRRAGTQWRE